MKWNINKTTRHHHAKGEHGKRFCIVEDMGRFNLFALENMREKHKGNYPTLEVAQQAAQQIECPTSSAKPALNYQQKITQLMVMLIAHCGTFIIVLFGYLAVAGFFEKTLPHNTALIMPAGYFTVRLCVWLYKAIIRLVNYTQKPE